MEEMKKLTMNEFLERMKQKGYNTFTRMPCGCALCDPKNKITGEIYDMTREMPEPNKPTTAQYLRVALNYMPDFDENARYARDMVLKALKSL